MPAEILKRVSGLEHKFIEAFATVTYIPPKSSTDLSLNHAAAIKHIGTIEWGSTNGDVLMIGLKGGKLLTYSFAKGQVSIEVHRYLYDASPTP